MSRGKECEADNAYSGDGGDWGLSRARAKEIKLRAGQNSMQNWPEEKRSEKGRKRTALK